MKIRLLLPCLLLVLLVPLAACDQLSGENPLAPTLTALNSSINLTATAVGQQTEKLTGLGTVEAQATAAGQAIEATQVAQVAEQAQEEEATAEASSPVLAELPTYGLDPAGGELGWVHPSLDLSLNAYHEYKFGNDFMGVTAADFLWSADITWDTQYGGSGCGLMFRSNGDQENPDAYMVMITRFANGHAVFFGLADGEIANFHDFYPRSDDASFSAENQTTNRLAVLARGNIIDIYTNGVKVASVDASQAPVLPNLPSAPRPPADKKDLPAMEGYAKALKEYEEITATVRSNYQIALSNYRKRQALYSDGFLAMTALSESGDTLCRFDNAYLWLIK